MRMIRAAFLILSVAILPSRMLASERYVPATGWKDDARTAPSYERWFGRQLHAMGERPLALKRGLVRRFRFVALPNRQGAFAFRVDIRTSGSMLLRWVELDGYGGYDPGNIRQEGQRDLRPAERRRFSAALEAAALDSRPRELDEEGLRKRPDGSEVFTICHHATYYIFEEIDATGRHYVQRQFCWVEDSLTALKEELFRLAKAGRPPMRRLDSEPLPKR